MIDACMKAGAVDGITRRREPTVDTLSADTHAALSSRCSGYHGETFRDEESGHERSGRLPRQASRNRSRWPSGPARRFPAASPTTSATWSRSRIYVERAAGSRKWDVDGHEYVDYWMGHGSLFLGHCHPAAVKAVQEQMARGTHMGACHAAGGAVGRAGQPADPERRADALHHVGHRGHAPGHARGARVHRPPEDREAGRSLPRLARRRGGRREPAVRGAVVGGRADGDDRPGGRSARPTTSRPSSWPSSGATSPRSSSSRPAAARGPRRRSPAIWPSCARWPRVTTWC